MNRIDLNWDDNEVLPDRIRPDVEFLFYRMSRATIDMVDPKPAQRVLDIGCGRAIDIVNMSKSGATLIGVEPSTVSDYDYSSGSHEMLSSDAVEPAFNISSQL